MVVTLEWLLIFSGGVHRSWPGSKGPTYYLSLFDCTVNTVTTVTTGVSKSTRTEMWCNRDTSHQVINLYNLIISYWSFHCQREWWEMCDGTSLVIHTDHIYSCFTQAVWCHLYKLRPLTQVIRGHDHNTCTDSHTHTHTHTHSWTVCGQVQPRNWLAVRARAPDAVVIPHHIDALCVRHVAVFNEEVEDAPAAELKLLSDETLQIRHHATCVQVHEQPAHAAIDDSRRRVVKV